MAAPPTENPTIPGENADGSADKLEALFGMLERGEVKSLSELQSRLETPTEKALLQGACLLRTFDEEIYSVALRFFPPKDLPPVSFAEFTKNPNLEKVPRTENTFRVKDAARENALREWTAQRQVDARAALTSTTFFQRLRSHYRPSNDLDRLSILLITNPAEARQTFLDLFGEADRNFDLAKCNDILTTVEDKLLLAPELKPLWRQKRQYLNARHLFAPEYSQTVFYYARKSIVKAFDNLLKGKATSEWIFQLYAKGGMGKTMFVRWLLARHCVPSEIPIARLDFDFVNRQMARRYPWLLFLSIAEQLNKQLADEPFNRYLRNYFHVVSLLTDDGSGPVSRSAREKELKSVESQLRDTIVSNFIDALTESSFRGTFVIVLDTLEEMSLQRKQSLMAILNQLREIHDGCDRARLLLVGRYNLAACLREFKSQFGPATVTHELEPFKRREARAYLTTNRELTNKAIVNAIITKCESDHPDETDGPDKRRGSNPFKLSLLADLYEQQEIKTEEDVRSYPSTDIEYLIERIIWRIKEPAVQWLLRYAVIPRQFTFEFFEEVLAYHLEQELIKQRRLDDVNRRFPKGAESYNDREHWKPVPQSQRSLNLRAIWNDLRKYGSNYSFITFESRSDSAPRIQPDVVVPMRRLLSGQRVFGPLHLSAEKYFLGKVRHAKDPKVWAENAREAIYHRFQRRGADAGAFWREYLGRVKCRRDPEIRKLIAEEIVRRDYVNEVSGEPLRRLNGEYLVAPEDVGHALNALIEADVACMGHMPPAEQITLWEDVGDRLTQCEELQNRHGRRIGGSHAPFNAATLRRLASVMTEAEIDFKKLTRTLRSAIRTTESDQMQLSLVLQLADALVVQNDERALDYYKYALSVVRPLKCSRVNASDVYLKIGQVHYEWRNYRAAERAYHSALQAATERDDFDTARDTLRNLADLNLELGLYSKAWDQLDEGIHLARLGREKPEVLDGVLSSHIKARGFYQPLQALNDLTPYLRIVKTVRERATTAETRGLLLGKLMKFEEAVSALETAKQFWTEAPDRVRTERARRRRVELQLFDIGNLHEADYTLTTWETIGWKIDPELTCQLRILRVLWTHRVGNTRKARQQWSKILRDENVLNSPRALVRALAAGLALGFGDRPTVKKFIRALKKIKPAAARLPLLNVFEYAVPNHRLNDLPEMSEIRDLVLLKPTVRDLIPYALTSADVLAWCGSSRRLKKNLDTAFEAARKRKNWFACRNILLALDRLKLSSEDTPLLPESEFLTYFADYPTLCAAALVEQAQRHLNRGDLERCKETLDRAANHFQQSGTTTELEARFHYLSAELHKAKGQSKLAVKEFRAALSRYEKLGNQPMAQALRGLIPTLDLPAKRNAETMIVRITKTSKGLSVERFLGDVLISSTPAPALRIQHLNTLVRAEIADRSALYQFAKSLISKPRDVERELGAILFNNASHRRPKASDCQLDSLTPSLGKVPWELAQFKNQPLRHWFRCFYRSASQTVRNVQAPRWLQLALQRLVMPSLVADGFMGQQTLQGLNQLRRKFNLPETVDSADQNARIGKLLAAQKVRPTVKVLLLHGSTASSGSGHLEDRAPLVGSLYRDHGCRLEMVRASNPRSLIDKVQHFQPDVIHIISSFKEVPSTGQVYLDFDEEEMLSGDIGRPNFGGDAMSWSSGRDPFSFAKMAVFSPSYLNDTLALYDRAKLRPVVIIDAECPSGITELIHQLIYRNVFAAELFQVGYATAVIAIGLAKSSNLYFEQARRLITGVSNSMTIAEIVNGLRLSSARDLAEQIATAGVVLFANEPYLTVLPAE